VPVETPGAGQAGDERDVHLLAARLQLVAARMIEVERRRPCRARTGSRARTRVDLLGELDELVVALNGRDGHGRGSFRAVDDAVVVGRIERASATSPRINAFSASAHLFGCVAEFRVVLRQRKH
jgi:hypothetical protein